MNKKILISTGGSGGHVIPATIIYKHLENNFDVYMTSDIRGVKFLNKDEYNLKIFNVRPISKNLLIMLFNFLLMIILIFKSIFFLRKNKINILISTGGYMSLPLCIGAKILNIKLLLFEPNMVLGRSNKFFISYCQKIFCYSNNVKKFPIKLKNKIKVIPALLRKNFYDKRDSNITLDTINLLIIGGSQGAKIFDDLVKNAIIELSKKYKLKIYQQTSSINFESFKKTYENNNINCELFNFNDDIINFMHKTDLCITRAGASTLAELNFTEVPYLAIPLPTAKDNHQFENAYFYNKLGFNWLLNQKEIDEKILLNKLINIIDNKEEYLAKKKNMKDFNYENTWNNINQKIISVINEN
ncbi:UDP-N-acetylglucosamine--N-acetylmuramyl-(pentapeptide) pyrophosphoryl-undecaprenol N-acetylglucosamine transferase [Candidatus Pelagibacter giovannonii]|uniref:UDP-N-acetylglucosamine--N-acetylmuramyl-(pentapeptide) pyrophosphoryl-undecaprenol N-acetylglucosamine transferase n=1 Tax=Candidatus Pelagibacter giovannonii TaxID=2563896 RepID=A0A6H1Q587_9PROT|nr:UDP-N-acetylglucosamine--N-acetylmuramyl-(pentapeptide) pyrophosphoryl-undecaprenol N-acetylglucosamine transferase [Candidatus Pelagibacter giovannonii]QIZ21375.1 UDP-N-acetylglucosamine--N-acetylmuramyl-(pentapeptide) pyrophosphoryl-undecaprenol N-acetylglucosamine transferase [Candidatus Pelagibacter giovannonii]